MNSKFLFNFVMASIALGIGVAILAILAKTAQESQVTPYVGVFGIPKGTPVNKLVVSNKLDDHLLEVVPPHPENAYLTYYVGVKPNQGVCSVVGASEPMVADDFKFYYATVKDDLTEQYGNPVVGATNVSGDNLFWFSSPGNVFPLNVDMISAMVDKKTAADGKIYEVLMVSYMYNCAI